MNTNTKQQCSYPISLPGIKSYGIEKWLSEYNPILPGIEFQKVYEIIFNAYADTLLKNNKEDAVYWSGAINYKFPMILAESYFRYLCLIKLKKNGTSIVFLQCLKDIDFAISETINGAFIEQQRYFIGLKDYILETLRLIKLNIKNYGFQDAVTCLIPNCKCCVITDPEDKYIKAFVKEYNLSPQCLRPSLFLPSRSEIENEGDNPEALKFVDTFFDLVCSKDSRATVFFNHQLKRNCVQIFSKTIQNFKYLRNKLKDKSLGTLLVQSLTNPESRLLAAVWKDLGGETIGFAHGNGYLTSYGGSDVNNGTHLVVDKYIVSSPGEKVITEYIRERMQSKLAAKDEIIALHNSFYKGIFQAMQKDPAVTKIKKIMIIAYPMDYHYYPYLQDHNTQSYTHLTLNIMKELKKAGYYTIYKDHPDTLSQTVGFFEEYADEVITTNFNEVYTQADCFFFITPYSTTFGYSAMSKVPIVYVNNLNFDFWQPDLKLLLDKRAVPFDVSSDADGVLQFPKDNLLNSIENSLHRIDYAVVEKFALGV